MLSAASRCGSWYIFWMHPDGESFPETLRAAIVARGLTLDRLAHRMALRGHPLSPASLSYWSRGLRVPERAESIAARGVLEVTIRHSCAEDLGLSLVGPSGSVYALKYSGGYSCTPVNGPASYQIPVSGPATGRWQLRVTDYGYGDTGTLDRWSITL